MLELRTHLGVIVLGVASWCGRSYDIVVKSRLVSVMSGLVRCADVVCCQSW